MGASLLAGHGLLGRSSLRYIGRHPWQFGLSILGVALGVAVAVSVDLANASARSAFELSSSAVNGSTTHQIVGGSRGIDERLYRQLRVALGVRNAAPVVEGYVEVPGRPGLALRVLGIDPLAEAVVRPDVRALGAVRGFTSSAGSVDFTELMASSDGVVATVTTAADLELRPGQVLAIRAAGRERRVRLLGTFEPASELQATGLRDLLIADIGTAQELLDSVGRLSRIDLVLEAESEAEVIATIEAVLPSGTRLVGAAARTDATVEMTRAFRLNLRAMSLLAMVCGMFLIYNSMTFSIVQRRGLIGAMRALGVTRREIFAGVLVEAAGIGVLGTAIGLFGGVALGTLLVRLVTRTINDLYFVVTVRGLTVPTSSLAVGVALGVGATLLAALAPALEATRTTPGSALRRSAIESARRRRLPLITGAGLALALLGGLLVAVGGQGVVTFAGLFALLLGLALLAPVAALLLTALLGPAMRRAFGPIGNLAVRGVSANLSRTSVAVAALMVAVSVIIGVGVMVTSFRVTLERWLEYTLAADLYVAPVSVRGGAADLELDAARREALAALPGVERIQTIRGVQLETRDGSVTLLALDIQPGGESAYRLASGADDAWERFHAGQVLVSEPFASRTGLEPGSTLELPSDRGTRSFEVAGVYYSYASDRGAVMISRRTYDRLWDDPGVSGVGIYAPPGVDRLGLITQVRELFGASQLINVISNRQLREQSLRVFDRTFLITGVLRVLVMLVAFVGVLSALMAMQLERSREFGILRACGLTPAQLWGLVTAQTGLLGLVSGLLAVPTGLLLAWIMIFVINKRSFGWTLQMQIPPGLVLQAIALAVVAALLAGLYPAARMAATPPAGALREE